MLLPCDNEVFADKGDDSRISIDEGELDALATYLEAVQVFLPAYPQQESHVVAAPDSADMHDRHIISARSTDDKVIED